MRWRLTDDAEAYAQRAGALLAARPAECSMPLSVLDALRRGHRVGEGAPLLGWLEDDGGVRGAVQLTPPLDLVLAVVPAGAAPGLAAALRAAGAELPGATGPVAAVDAFAAAWAQATGCRARVAMRLLLHELTTLAPPDPPPRGRARPAAPDDLPLATAWLRAFAQDAGVPTGDPEAAARERVEDARLWLWEDEAGRPVALAARTAAAAGVSRIAPVYTPPERRGRGWGTAVTAAVVRDALDRGAEHVVLFTDAANPTAGAIYRRIGFREAGEQRLVRFDAG